MSLNLPDSVLNLTDVVSEKLGRPARCRKVLNRKEWYIHDPVFSFVQRGMRKGWSGYRVGYKINPSRGEVSFVLVHSPVVAQLFKRNLVFSSLIDVIRSSASYRRTHWLYRSSRRAIGSGVDDDGARIEADSVDDFIGELTEFDRVYGFVKDMFPKRTNTKSGIGSAPVAGNTFYLVLADRPEMLNSRSKLKKLVDQTWPLFLCMYPIQPVEGRSASLARNLRVRGIPKLCEFESIQLPSGVDISPLCRGELQGAHIKPDMFGGSDRPENGLWLCEYHHRATEGKLVGRRDENRIDVRFVTKR
jgi:hypothetical protein